MNAGLSDFELVLPVSEISCEGRDNSHRDAREAAKDAESSKDTNEPGAEKSPEPSPGVFSDATDDDRTDPDAGAVRFVAGWVGDGTWGRGPTMALALDVARLVVAGTHHDAATDRGRLAWYVLALASVAEHEPAGRHGAPQLDHRAHQLHARAFAALGCWLTRTAAMVSPRGPIVAEHEHLALGCLASTWPDFECPGCEVMRQIAKAASYVLAGCDLEAGCLVPTPADLGGMTVAEFRESISMRFDDAEAGAWMRAAEGVRWAVRALGADADRVPASYAVSPRSGGIWVAGGAK